MKTFCQIDNQWIDVQRNNNYFVYGGNLLKMYKEKNKDLIQSMYPSFISCSEYSEGLMIVQGKNGKFGYMDKEGILRVPCIYKGATPYFGGIAIVYDGYFHVLDYQGRMVISDNYDDIRYYDEKGEYLQCSRVGNCHPIMVQISDLVGRYTYPKDDIQNQLMLLINNDGVMGLCEMPVINGFMPILRNGLWGIQDRQGNVIELACHKRPYLPYNSMFSTVKNNYLKIVNLETRKYKYIDGSLYDHIWNILLHLDKNPSVHAQYLPTGQIQNVSSVIHIDDNIIGKARKRIK